MKKAFYLVLILCLLIKKEIIHAQKIVEKVNVFLGSSGDHGQMSPGASSPFHQMSILPHTYPQLHTGYEFLAKKIIGFTHNRMEGTGCKGSGGLIMIKPYLGENFSNTMFTKISEKAGPGFYEINLQEGIQANFAVHHNYGIHQYTLPRGNKGFLIDLGYALNDALVDNKMQISNHLIKGTIRAKTTCNIGIYTIYYALEIEGATLRQIEQQKVDVRIPADKQKQEIKISFSAVSEAHAVATLNANRSKDFNHTKRLSEDNWEKELSAIQVEGNNEERKKLFYSLLYRTMQSPYQISESDYEFKATDGNRYKATSPRYHGWAIWDNYKTQLPLLALLNPNRFQDIVYSITNLYKYGKYDFAGPNEPANSVRTEHAAVVLLDARNKNFSVPIDEIKDKLIQDTATFDFTKPDKFLEATYDMWAMSKLIPSQKEQFINRAKSYKSHWLKEFKDLTKNDVDRMSARKMYQGTIRQYRWNVPFDTQGLTELMGGKANLTAQLDDFFDNHYFNRANEPDIQSPTLYYASNKPWRYQSLVHELTLDTVIQYYFNDNSRGIDPFIDRIYKNEPKAFIRTMDDDAGAMSGWFVLSAIGIHQPLIGEPIYYVNVPFFPEITINNGNNKLQILVKNFSDKNRYIKSIKLNNKPLNRLWVTHEEISQDAVLEIEATGKPTTFGVGSMYVSSLDE